MNLLSKINLYLLLALAAAGCGQVKLGGTPNDAAPGGTVRDQGAFTSLNGWTVTGTATIYDEGGGSFVARLNGITVSPGENGLEVVVTASDGSTPLVVALRADSGTQNYLFSYTPIAGGAVASFSQVAIHSIATNRDYGQALLQNAQAPQ